MYDIFISHSSLDKSEFVEPLVKKLTELGLCVWYDKHSIHKGDKIKESIINGINQSLVFIAVISENYYKSNWSSLELGILEANYPNNSLPLIFENVKEKTANTFPFLLDNNYLLIENDITQLAGKLANIVLEKKQLSGYWHINKTNINSLIKEMFSYSDFKLEQIAIQLGNVSRKFNSDSMNILNDIKMIIEIVLMDVAKTENIYIDNVSSILETFINIEFLSQNLKEHIKFICSLYQENIRSFNNNNHIISDNIYLLQYSLYSIIEWYMMTYFKKPVLNTKRIIPVLPEEFTEEDIIETYKIEQLVLPSKLIASIETDIKWYKHNPLIMLGARDVDTGKLIGFFTTLPITDELYEQIRNGDFDDTKFDENHIRLYDVPGFYKLYLCSLCIHPLYNTTSAFKTIYTSFIDFLLNLAIEREIYISCIIADGVTLKGSNLCKSIGMNKITESVHNSEIFEAVLLPPTSTTLHLKNKMGQKLLAYYQRIYNEYRDIF